MANLVDLFAPGNVASIFGGEVEKNTRVQATRIEEKVKAALIKAANENQQLPGATSIDEKFIYKGNLDDLNKQDVSVFRVEYTWHDPCLVMKFTRKSIVHFLVWDKALADDFDDLVLAPHFRSMETMATIESYKYSEVKP